MCSIGYSVYYSQYKALKDFLMENFVEGSLIFTSLHIAEEFGEGYVEGVKAMMKDLNDKGYKIMADVSSESLEVFKCKDLMELKELLNLHILRLDCGFTLEETIALSSKIPVCLNASTLKDKVENFKGLKVMALHNFYPRPETALDREYFIECNRLFKSYGIEVMAFIPSSFKARGPLYKTLPTLEEHRGMNSYVAFVDMVCNLGLEKVFVGDGILSVEDLSLIRRFIEEGLISIPCKLNQDLYNKVFTIRPDSPSTLHRLMESRLYATIGKKVRRGFPFRRSLGTITMDNEKYLRYSGEIQITGKDYPRDRRVNVIGRVYKSYRKLLTWSLRGKKIVLINIKKIRNHL